MLQSLLPTLQARWQARQRPLLPVLAWASQRYTAVLTVDGSTLDALLRKVGLLREAATHPLVGRMMALLDLCSWLPRHIWYEEDAQAHDQRFGLRILAVLQAGTLLIAVWLGVLKRKRKHRCSPLEVLNLTSPGGP